MHPRMFEHCQALSASPLQRGSFRAEVSCTLRNKMQYRILYAGAAIGVNKIHSRILLKRMETNVMEMERR